jgi:hypothetical protein
MGFGNLVTIKKTGCWIKKGIIIKKKHMKVRLVHYLPIILQQLLSYSSYYLVTTTVV